MISHCANGVSLNTHKLLNIPQHVLCEELLNATACTPQIVRREGGRCWEDDGGQTQGGCVGGGGSSGGGV